MYSPFLAADLPYVPSIEERVETFSRISAGHLESLIGPILTVKVQGHNGNLPAQSRFACSGRCLMNLDIQGCQRAWERELERLHAGAQPFWHQCMQGQWCAVVPVFVEMRPIVALVCSFPASAGEMCRRAARLLELLAREVVNHEVRLMREMDARGVEIHPQVWNALLHIHERLSSPELSVGSVAEALGANSSYLAHLFSIQTRERMRRYIQGRRVHLSKVLLALPGMQVKQVAFETGHANTDWFSHIFHVQTGLTPSGYREALLH